MSNKTKLQHSLHTISHGLPRTVLTIFGATGDLAMHYLLPALVHMCEQGLLAKDFTLVCVGRRPFSTAHFVAEIVLQNPGLKFSPKTLKTFQSFLHYYQGEFDDEKSFVGLKRLLADRDVGKGHICSNRLYYFATAPQYFEPLARMLKSQGLLIGCSEHQRTIRLLVEKPFGHDLQTAKKLNSVLRKFFLEEQIYRIDHYLGKETVQNLLVVRFANDLFEPVWNKNYIDHVQISGLESVGVKNRINFYDQTGATKDLVQNHMLQMLALIAMEEPKDLSSESIRTSKVKVLQALPRFTAKTLATNLVRGQYKEYSGEVGKPSRTETFVAFKTFINNPRWQGVPFYLRTGKRLNKKVTEISIHFKKKCALFGNDQRANNILTFRIQPDESVQMQINNKVPGFGIQLHRGSLDFGYKTAFLTEIPGAYERLLLDFIQGDQRLFIRSDEIEAAWKFVDSIVKKWNSKNAPVKKYASGSFGPDSANQLLLRDDRSWQAK